MSYADRVFVENCREILSHGVWDRDYPVRPKWEDGTPAHTIKLFGIVNRYDLSEESTNLFTKRSYFQSTVARPLFCRCW